MVLVLLLALSSDPDIKQIECKVRCQSEGYDTGQAYSKGCACIDYWPTETMTTKIKIPKRLRYGSLMSNFGDPI